MNIEIWSKDNCQFCDMAKRWFASQGLEFKENKIGYNGITREMLLEKVPGARSVPQIFIDDKLIGGWDDLRQSDFYRSQS